MHRVAIFSSILSEIFTQIRYILGVVQKSVFVNTVQ